MAIAAVAAAAATPAAAAAAAHAAGFKQRRLFAALGLATIIAAASAALATAVYLLPHPPRGMGWTSIPWSDTGATLPELGQIAAMAAAFSAAILGTQELVLRPLYGRREKTTTGVRYGARAAHALRLPARKRTHARPCLRPCGRMQTRC